jgi:hypothetical protein
MQETSSIAETPTRQKPPPIPVSTLQELQINHIVATRELARTARSLPLVATVRQQIRQLAAIYMGPACAHPLILAAALTAITYTPNKRPLLTLVLLYGTWFLQNVTPVALAGTLIFTKHLRFLILAVLALMAVMHAWELQLGVPNIIENWLKIAGVPIGAILLFNVRRIRGIGPSILAATLFFFFGIVAGIAYGVLYVWDVIGPVRFIREDLAHLPILAAAGQYWGEMFSSPRMIEKLMDLVSHPLNTVQVDHPERWTSRYQLLLVGGVLLTTALGAVSSWAFVRWLANRYRVRRASDQMLNIDVLMVIFTLGLFLVFTIFGVLPALSVLASFVVYKFVTHWLLRRRQYNTPLAAPRTLLLLRVFREDRSTLRLLEDLMQRWRYLGPVRLIAATDLVDSTIEPHEFFDFLSGHLSRAFVKDQEDLNDRLSGQMLEPDPDGLYRIEDFFCHDNTWKMAVEDLAKQADVVLMDLRGFTSARGGCTFEIEMLMHSVPVDRVVFLVDDSTDFSPLEQILQYVWRTMPSDSPNVSSVQHQVRLVHAFNHRRTLDSLLGLLCENITPRPATSIAAMAD